jgi:hypothetical protein
MSYSIRRFSFNQDEAEWNAFVNRADNSTFLFNRGFMDYHKDRFQDHSLMIYHNNKIVACLPANECDGRLYSHQGLTYGGLIIEKKQKLSTYIQVFSEVFSYYYENNFRIITYKAFPRFYNQLQTDEIEYCLFIANATLIRRDTALAIHYKSKIPYSKNIIRDIKKAKKNEITVTESSDFKLFWNEILTPNLQKRFGVNPVHSLEEILMLKKRFENIRLFIALNKEGNILAGIVFFVTDQVAHCQYISASEEGRYSGALNLLFATIIDQNPFEKDFFDFGIANEDNGKSLNKGLLVWKEKMGGRTYSHDFYEIETKNYQLLNEILA